MSKPCTRGNVAGRNKWGACQCAPCLDAQRLVKRAWRKANDLSNSQTPCKASGAVGKRDKNGHCHCEACVVAKRPIRNASVARHRQSHAARAKEWRENNPERRAAYYEATKAERLARTRAYQLGRRNRTPAWADLDAIEAIYIEAARLSREIGVQHHVDHVIPLNGKYVSGNPHRRR